jgi:DNA-binding transcriptional ArsR family regulator
MENSKISKNMEILRIKAEIFKALAHPSRIRIVEALEKGEMCVCELQKFVEGNMSTVSKHLSVLKNAGIVSVEKRGMNVYYTLRAACVPGFSECIEEMIRTDADGKSALASACRARPGPRRKTKKA